MRALCFLILLLCAAQRNHRDFILSLSNLNNFRNLKYRRQMFSWLWKIGMKRKMLFWPEAVSLSKYPISYVNLLKFWVKFDSEITNRAFTGIKDKQFRGENRGNHRREYVDCRWREFYRQFRYYRASGKKWSCEPLISWSILRLKIS